MAPDSQTLLHTKLNIEDPDYWLKQPDSLSGWLPWRLNLKHYPIHTELNNADPDYRLKQPDSLSGRLPWHQTVKHCYTQN